MFLCVCVSVANPFKAKAIHFESNFLANVEGVSDIFQFLFKRGEILSTSGLCGANEVPPGACRAMLPNVLVAHAKARLVIINDFRKKGNHLAPFFEFAENDFDWWDFAHDWNKLAIERGRVNLIYYYFGGSYFFCFVFSGR